MQAGTRRKLKIAGLVLGAVVLVAVALVGNLLVKFFHVDPVKLDDKLWVYLGGGGNTAALLTDKGVVLVDTKLWIGASKLFEDVEALHAGPVRAIVNTHFHLDHTHGNPLAPAGTAIYATAPVSALMLRFDADFWAKEPAKSRMPNQPFSGETRVEFGDETLRLLQIPPSHTAGDLVVLFEKRRLLHAGDLFFNGIYPRIDLPGGGSVKGAVAACDVALALPFDTVIPGHGPIGKRADLEKQRAFYAALWEYGKGAHAQGMTVAQAVEKAPPALRGLDDLTGITSLKGSIETAMEEAGR